jgi:hydroxypyruvate isomerase
MECCRIEGHRCITPAVVRSRLRIACHPDRTSEFRAGVERAIDYASALRCTKVNCLAGILPEGLTADAARATLIENLSTLPAGSRPLGSACIKRT